MHDAAEVNHLLVVDDDGRIRKLLGQYLTRNGFFVSLANNAQEARELLELFVFDLLILDIMMPGETGKELAVAIRQHSQVPIVMLTAMGDIEDRIRGLESGADDYVSKPFEPRELLLRINKIIARAKPVWPKEVNVVNFGCWQFDLASNRLTYAGSLIPLTSGEAKLLSFLAANMGTPISRGKLAELCGGINERSVDVQIIRLRNKIEIEPKKPAYIQTVRGEGYVLYN